MSCSRRRFLLGLAGLALLPAACSMQQRPLTIAAGGWQGYQSLFLARRRQMLQPSQIRLVEVPANASSLRALASGLVDGAALTLDEVLRLRAAGVTLSIVLVMDISAGADMLLVRPKLTTLAALRGQRIAVDPVSNGVLLLAKALEKAGLHAQDVVQVHLPISDQPAAWRDERIDAAITYDPYATQLRAEGAVRLFDSSQAQDTIVDVLAMRTEVLVDHNGPALRHLLQAHFAMIDFIRTQPQLAAEAMAPHLHLSPQQVLASFAGVHLPDALENHRLLRGAEPALLISARSIADFMFHNGLLVRADDLQQLINGEFLPEVFTS